jgi:2-keto-4-pentenoate hydratase/2-oxohepta-3-ene-1,7-dioic acid hydratase in catechol pathway
VKWATYSSDGVDRVGLVIDEEIRTLEVGAQLIDLLGDDGSRLRDAGDRALRAPDSVIALRDAKLRAPIPSPPSIRDFFAFEQHAVSGLKALGLEINPGWYEIPVFYFTSPGCVHGTGETVTFAGNAVELDFELEMAAIVGRAGKNLDPEEAKSHIAGYCVFNDWSARDLQHLEMAITPIGPSKGKDFGNGLGPFLVTPDEIESKRTGVTFDLAMVASVNGEEYGRGSLADVYWGFNEMISYASREAVVRPGDIIGSGTCARGCLMELRGPDGDDKYPWLKAGDEVSLEIEGIGTLRNTIAQGATPKPLRPGRSKS